MGHLMIRSRRLWTIVILILLTGCRELRERPSGGIGVNLAGAEFGSNVPDFSSGNPGLHGQDYMFPSEKSLSYYAQRGINLVRLPLSWERLQPKPMYRLDPTYMGRIEDFLDLALMHGCQVVLDLHNYGRFREQHRGRVRELLLGASTSRQEGLNSAALADLWLRVAQRVSRHPALHAYGLMNEPHDMGAGSWLEGGGWHAISRHVVATLRASGDQNWIWVAGDGWSKASEWDVHNPPTPWVSDTLGRVAYEAHVYFDRDASGRYQVPFAEERRIDPQIHDRAVKNLAPFSDWCSQNDVPGVIGEFGIPWNDGGWLPLLDRFLAEVQEQGMIACAWAGGDMWGDYILSLNPPGIAEAPPLLVIQRRHHFVARD